MSLKPSKKLTGRIPNFIDDLYSDDLFLGATPDFEHDVNDKVKPTVIVETDPNHVKPKRRNFESSRNQQLGENKEKAS